MSARDAVAVARIQVRLVPGASRDEVEGTMADGRLKIRLRAKAVEDAANRSLVEFVAARLGVPRARVALVSGARSRQKTLEIQGLESKQALRSLLDGTEPGRRSNSIHPDQ